jgi:hypothetical protein
MSRRFLAFAAAASLCAAPAAAAPSPAPAPAAETVDGSALHGIDPAYWILPLLIVIALLIAILASEEPNSKPASP